MESQGSRKLQANRGTHALDNASAGIRLYVIHKLLDLLLNPGLGLQNLTAFDVQEAEGVDITKSVKELRLREGIFRVALGLLERDASLQGKGTPVSLKGHSPSTLHLQLGWRPIESEQP